MESMAEESLGGSGGSKTCLFFFSQPSGVVTTTSSNSRVCPLSIEIDMTSDDELIWTAFVESSILAVAIAGAAILSIISLYVPAANKFSSLC